MQIGGWLAGWLLNPCHHPEEEPGKQGPIGSCEPPASPWGDGVEGDPRDTAVSAGLQGDPARRPGLGPLAELS